MSFVNLATQGARGRPIFAVEYTGCCAYPLYINRKEVHYQQYFTNWQLMAAAGTEAVSLYV